MIKINIMKGIFNKMNCLFLFFLLFVSFGFSQEIKVSGVVKSSFDNLPLPGVNVTVVNSNNGVTTDFDGNFEILIEPNAQLQFSFIGYVTQTISVDGRTTINLTLDEDVNSLDEIVVIGYGTQKKELITGASVQVDGGKLERTNTINPILGMQGLTPGVQITSTSGQPGESLKVVIRGVGSTGGSTPTYVVDGVITGDISYLNNSDVESISVLKDAASAAIYGSQASNGVIIVTTKKGKVGASQITFDSYYGVQSAPDYMDLLNATEYATILNEAAVNSGNVPLFTNAEIDVLGAGTNWLDEMFVDNAVTENYSFGASGGSEASVYSTSLSYTGQEGIVGGKDLSNYERYNFRFNSEHKLLDGLFTIGENLSFAYIKQNGIGVGGQYNNSLRGAFGTNSILPMYDDEGNYYNTAGDTEPWLTGVSNPYAAMVYGNQNESNTQKLIGNFYVEVEPMENLTFRTSLGLDYYASEGHSFSPIYQLSIYSFNTYTTASQSMSKGRSLTWDNLLTYKFDLNQDHHFETLLGTSSFQYNGTSMYGSNANLVFDDLKHAWLDNATNTDGALISLSGGPNGETKRMSYFGRVNYNYKDKYLVNATFRADGSSNFHPDNQWGYFPSISAGWIATNEKFLEDSNAFNFLKVRVSWGQVGNQNAGAFQYLAPITTANTNYIFGNVEGVLTPGAYPNRLANPDLKWETSEQINIGFDTRLLDNRLSVNFDWYRKTNKDWLIRAPILATAGADAPWINGGNVVNTGVELAFQFNDNIGDFNYYIGVNGAYNKNTVGEIPTEDGLIHGGTGELWDNSSEFYRAEEGFPLGYFWGYETAGVFQNQDQLDNNVHLPTSVPGDLIFVDKNNDGVIDAGDKTMIGDPNPDFTFGLSFSGNYKAFDFAIAANGVMGNELVQSYRNQSNAYGNYSSAILNRWHGEGSSNTLPRVTQSNVNENKFSDIYIQEGDFLRISNITLGYDVTKNIFKENFFAKELRLYVSALNVFTFTNYDGMDPEIGFGNQSFSSGVDVGYYPRPKTYMVGLNFKF